MRVEIFDTENLLSGRLRILLDSHPFQTVSSTEPNADIIVCVHDQDGSSIEVLRCATVGNLKIPVLIITEGVPEDDIRCLLAMGAGGVLLRKTAGQHLPWAIPAILKGCLVLSPEIVEFMISERLESPLVTPQEQSACERMHRLSRREQQVLQLLSRGMSNRDIARTLFISPETVKDHVRAVRSKLGVSTRVHAARVAWLARGSAAGNAA
ncbi:LuxR C-terminal-related transcriptional regulator [Streptomyces sp. NPDC057301]|uniref:response regulator transcription factor n=1 Tax=Streptomyces sp. NPDC057301 TaxID=3346093 RepID=UPI003641154D